MIRPPVPHTLTWIVRPMFRVGLNVTNQFPYHLFHSRPSDPVQGGSCLDVDRVPYVLYGVKYIDLVSLAPVLVQQVAVNIFTRSFVWVDLIRAPPILTWVVYPMFCMVLNI